MHFNFVQRSLGYLLIFRLMMCIFFLIDLSQRFGLNSRFKASKDFWFVIDIFFKLGMLLVVCFGYVSNHFRRLLIVLIVVQGLETIYCFIEWQYANTKWPLVIAAGHIVLPMTGCILATICYIVVYSWRRPYFIRGVPIPDDILYVDDPEEGEEGDVSLAQIYQQQELERQAGATATLPVERIRSERLSRTDGQDCIGQEIEDASSTRAEDESQVRLLYVKEEYVLNMMIGSDRW